MTTCPNRGFNIYGPAPQSGWENLYDIHNSCQHAASAMNANVIRREFSWSTFEPNQGEFNYNYANQFKSLIDAGRSAQTATQTQLKLLPYIKDVPSWVPQDPTWVSEHPAHFSVPGSAQYVTTPTGYSLYGKACSDVLVVLAGYADFIELNNEPNGSTAQDGSDIPALHCGRMAAHAIMQVDYCFNQLTPTKFVLVGSLAPGLASSVPYISSATNEMYRVIREDFYPPATYPTQFSRLVNS